MSESKKYDQGKPRMELLPGDALQEVAKVLAAGAIKYDDHNWRQGMAHSRLIGAALRHIHAFNDGEDLDPETGLSHLAHASCCLLFLTTYKLQNLGIDDRHFKDGGYVADNEEYDKIIASHYGYAHKPYNLRLEAGAVYKTRLDNLVKVEFMALQGDLPGFFVCSDGIHRTLEGSVGSEICDQDLIERVYEEENSLSKSGAQ